MAEAPYMQFLDKFEWARIFTYLPFSWELLGINEAQKARNELVTFLKVS